ncbi:MAG: endoribonuclease MazF [Candidatus Dadabacteria bacterium]|nr:endoribonuclease MazF [Candidatus Dadabacteria bacterium]
MAPGDYVPKCGDAVWINLNPQAGHEQAGRRPAVVLSPLEYNDKVGLALFCPVTNQRKDYPFEVPIPPNRHVGGVILADQIKSLDWRTRNVEFICTLPENVVAEVMAKIETLLSSSV